MRRRRMLRVSHACAPHCRPQVEEEHSHHHGHEHGHGHDHGDCTQCAAGHHVRRGGRGSEEGRGGDLMRAMAVPVRNVPRPISLLLLTRMCAPLRTMSTTTTMSTSMSTGRRAVRSVRQATRQVLDVLGKHSARSARQPLPPMWPGLRVDARPSPTRRLVCFAFVPGPRTPRPQARARHARQQRRH